MGNQFGQAIKRLRRGQQMLQREVAASLGMDTAILSKIEHGERRARKEQIVVFASVLRADGGELLTYWLADQITGILENEDLALQAMQVAEEQVKYRLRKSVSENGS